MAKIEALTREDLRTRYGIECEFVRVKDMSRVTGIAATTLYTRIRNGDLPVPVRRVGDMPLVRVDHLLAWLNGSDEEESISVPDVAPVLAPLNSALPKPVDRLQAAFDRASANVEKARARRLGGRSGAARS